MNIGLTRRIAAALIVLAIVPWLAQSATAAQEDLNDLARSNVGKVIDFLRWVGNGLEADNVQAWLDAGNIKMDEDLGENTGAETDGNGVITVRKADIAMVDLGGSSRIRMYAAIVELAALLVHEKVHAHQNSPNWFLSIKFKLSTATNIWEIQAYRREIDVRAAWIEWLIGEYTDEVRLYNPQVEAFNALARAIAEGQDPNKSVMLELLGAINAETRELIAKKQNIIDMIAAILDRAKVLKKANYEKQNHWYDQMKDDWQTFHDGWSSNMRVLGQNRERGQDWASWLEQDPPPLPELLNVLSLRTAMDRSEIQRLYEEAVADGEAWERQSDAEKTAHLMPFLEQVASASPEGWVHLLVYTDVTYAAYYNRTEEPLGIEVRDGNIIGIALSDHPPAATMVHVPESSILRIITARDAAEAYGREVARGYVRFENGDMDLSNVILVLVLGGLVVLVLVWSRRR